MNALDYLAAIPCQLCMPRNEGCDPSTGICSNGNVLTGKYNVAQAHRLETLRATIGAHSRLAEMDSMRPILHHPFKIGKR